MQIKKEDKKKMGRPITKGRDKKLTLRVSQGELDLLDNLSKKLNISRVNVIMKALEELNK